MVNKKDKQTKQLNMAIPADLYDWMVLEAKKGNRSLAGFTRWTFQQLREKVDCK